MATQLGRPSSSGGSGTDTVARSTATAASADVAAMQVSQTAQDTLIAAAATKVELAAVQALVSANVDKAVVTVDRQPDMSLLVTYDDATTDTVAAAGIGAETDPIYTADKPDIALKTELHDAVTLAAGSDPALSLAGQELSLTLPAGAAIDAVPTDGSTSSVQSDGVFDALALKADQTALDAEIAATDAEQTAQDTAIGLKADQAALDAEIARATAAELAKEPLLPTGAALQYLRRNAAGDAWEVVDLDPDASVIADFADGAPREDTPLAHAPSVLRGLFGSEEIDVNADDTVLEFGKAYRLSGNSAVLPTPSAANAGQRIVLRNANTVKSAINAAISGANLKFNSTGAVFPATALPPATRGVFVSNGSEYEFTLTTPRGVVPLTTLDNGTLLVGNALYTINVPAAGMTVKLSAAVIGFVDIMIGQTSAGVLRFEMEDLSNNISYFDANGALKVNAFYEFDASDHKGQHLRIFADSGTSRWGFENLNDEASAATVRTAYQDGEPIIDDNATAEDANIRQLDVPDNYVGTDMTAGEAWLVQPGPNATFPFTMPTIGNGANLLTAVAAGLLSPVSPAATANKSYTFNSSTAFNLSALELQIGERIFYHSQDGAEHNLRLLPDVTSGKIVQVDGVTVTPVGGLVEVTGIKKAIVHQTFKSGATTAGVTHITTFEGGSGGANLLKTQSGVIDVPDTGSGVSELIRVDFPQVFANAPQVSTQYEWVYNATDNSAARERTIIIEGVSTTEFFLRIVGNRHTRDNIQWIAHDNNVSQKVVVSPDNLEITNVPSATENQLQGNEDGTASWVGYVPGTPGYSKVGDVHVYDFGDGFVKQWGIDSPSGTGTSTVNFPVAMKNIDYDAHVTVVNNAHRSVHIHTKGLGSMSLNRSNTAAPTQWSIFGEKA